MVQKLQVTNNGKVPVPGTDCITHLLDWMIQPDLTRIFALRALVELRVGGRGDGGDQ